MKRGEIWTVSAGRSYASKPRPAVIVQDDRFDATASITVCVFTTEETDAPLIRLAVEPDVDNGLRAGSWLMVDKLTTVAKAKLGRRLLDSAGEFALSKDQEVRCRFPREPREGAQEAQRVLDGA